MMMPPKVLKKGSKGLKKSKKPRARNNVHLEQMTDSDASESLLGPEGPSQQAVYEYEDVEEGEEASERPEAHQEDLKDPDEDSGASARKSAHISDQLTMTQEQDLVDFFALLRPDNQGL